MDTKRLEAFSDGMIAIIITIMVLEFKMPDGASFSDLKPLIPIALSYLLSFIYIGIYWNNHHHMMYVAQKVNGAVLWANLHLLFWLSLTPFVTAWMGENNFRPDTLALYGGVLFMAAVAYIILQHCLLKGQGKESILHKAIGKDLKGKLSPLIYLVAIGTAYISSYIAGAMYILVAVLWMIPDPRIERMVKDKKELDQL